MSQKNLHNSDSDEHKTLLSPSLTAGLQYDLSDAAHSWIDHELPVVLSECLQRWRLTVERSLPGSTAVVLAVVDHELRPAVLKIHPNHGLAEGEISGYERWGGKTAPRMLRSDMSKGTLLLERVVPGVSQDAVREDSNAEHAARLLERTRDARATDRLPLPPLSGLTDRKLQAAERFVIDTQNVVSPRSISKARAVAAELSSSTGESTDLHGDFFPDNVLQDVAGKFLTIDPQPCHGDICFDAGTWSYAYGRGSLIDRNVMTFAEHLELDGERIRLWAFVVAVMNLARRAANGHASKDEIASGSAFIESFA